MDKLQKIQLIEEPANEELIQQELEEILGGWNCGTYSNGWFRDKCTQWNSGSCDVPTNGKNYCVVYDKHI